MSKKNSFWLIGSLLFSLPGLSLAADDLSALLLQVPAPPKTSAAAALRWQEGHSQSGSQVGFDKSAVALLAKLDKLEKTQMTTGQKFGGESAADLQSKMANMSQQEKMAYALQLSQKMQKDQRNAYTGSNAKAMQGVAQNNAASVGKSLAGETAAKAMSDTDAAYAPQFESLLTKMIADAKACPQEKKGDISGPAPSCVKVILAKYKADYTALTEKKMAKYSSIYADFKQAASAEIAGWQKDIATLEGSSTDTAGNEASRKKMMIYEDLRGLTIPADKAVDMGHQAVTLDPWKVCGGNCLQD